MKRVKLQLQSFEALPPDLNMSDYVDLLLLLLDLKLCVRLSNKNISLLNEMTTWCKKYGFVLILDREYYMYISHYTPLVYLLRFIDNSLMSHSYILGRLLGYPHCCSKKIQQIGEENIDKWEQDLCKSNSFNNEFRLINPVGYRSGASLISHVPCSPTCKESLDIAQVVYNFLKQNWQHKNFEMWKVWFN